MPSWGRIFNNTSYALQTQLAQLARVQEQIASGARVNRPSDDPGDAHRIMQLRAQSQSWDRYTGNIDSVELDLEAASTALQEVSEVLARAQELTTQQASGTYSPQNRASIADEIDSLLEQAVARGNHSVLGQYVFGGAKVTTEPFAVEREDGRIVSVTYQGSARELQVPVAPGVLQSGLLVGSEVFQASARQTPELFGETGAAVATGTSTVQGNTWLTVTHTTTDYTAGAASGLAAGTDSALGDTVLGEHTITVDDSAGTIRLDSGPAVTIADAADPANVELVNADGDVAYVDVSALTAGWDGQFTIASGGNLSINDGDDTLAIDFGADRQRVTDGATGRFLYVDATGIERTGAEAVRVPGTFGVFETLIHLRDVLENERGLSTDDQTALLEEVLPALDEATRKVTEALTVVGSRLQATDNLRGTIENLQADLDTQTASIENADVVELATELSRTETLYEMSMVAASKLLSISLLDFL